MGLKTTVCMCSWGKFWAKNRKKTKNPTATSKKLGAKILCREQKQGTSHAPCTQHHKEVGKTMKPPYCWPLDTPPPSPHTRNQLTRPQGASKGTHYLSLLPPAATGTPIQLCLNVLAWPHQFLLTGEGQEPWSDHCCLAVSTKAEQVYFLQL